MRISLLATLFIVPALGTAPALAGEDAYSYTQATAEKPAQVRVDFSDLNLASNSGRAQLAERVSAAVRQLCGEPAARNSLEAKAHRECVTKAKASAQSDIDVALADAARTTRNVAELTPR